MFNYVDIDSLAHYCITEVLKEHRESLFIILGPDSISDPYRQLSRMAAGKKRIGGCADLGMLRQV